MKDFKNISETSLSYFFYKGIMLFDFLLSKFYEIFLAYWLRLEQFFLAHNKPWDLEQNLLCLFILDRRLFRLYYSWLDTCFPFSVRCLFLLLLIFLILSFNFIFRSIEPKNLIPLIFSNAQLRRLDSINGRHLALWHDPSIASRSVLKSLVRSCNASFEETTIEKSSRRVIELLLKFVVL